MSSVVSCDNVFNTPDMYGTPVAEYGVPVMEYVVKGKVTDAESGNPVKGIQVTSEGGLEDVQTTESGDFECKGYAMPDDKVKLTFTDVVVVESVILEASSDFSRLAYLVRQFGMCYRIVLGRGFPVETVAVGRLHSIVAVAIVDNVVLTVEASESFIFNLLSSPDGGAKACVGIVFLHDGSHAFGLHATMSVRLPDAASCSRSR